VEDEVASNTPSAPVSSNVIPSNPTSSVPVSGDQINGIMAGVKIDLNLNDQLKTEAKLPSPPGDVKPAVPINPESKKISPAKAKDLKLDEGVKIDFIDTTLVY